MKISISITNYNRIEDITRIAMSLRYVKYIDECQINIYDDKSTEYGFEDLKVLFKEFDNVNIYINKTNLGADLNIYQTCVDFLSSDSDYLLLCDSDLILNPNSINFIKNNMKKTKGILSLFNSSNHKSYQNIDDIFVLKESIGSAGVVFEQKLLSNIINNISKQQAIMWDWNFSLYLKQKNIPIYVSKTSYIQHMGLNGENANFLLYDYGLDYEPITIFEKEELNKMYELYFTNAHFTPNTQIIKILIRKIFMNGVKKIVSALFGENFLLKILSYKKAISRI